MRLRTIAIGLVASTTLLVACGGSDDDAGVASLGTPSASASAGATAGEQDTEAALQAFSECMRDEGVEDFPDVTTDEEGRIEFGLPAGDANGQAPSEGEMREIANAMDACDDLLPEGTFGGDVSPEDEAAMQDAFLGFAECMRDEGVDVPDPQTGEGGFLIGPGPGGEGEAIDLDDPDVQDALEVCQPILDEVMPR